MDKQTITLDEPIKRGETTITHLEIRKPGSGALRGISLRDVLDFQTDAIIKVLPRVSEPSLTEAEVLRMDPADLLQAGAMISSFLLPKRILADAQEALESPSM